MSKDVINVGGEKKVVREDTAKAYRGTVWALISVAAFIIIGAILFLAFFGTSIFNTTLESPKAADEQRQPGR